MILEYLWEDDDPSSIDKAIKISKKTLKIVKQNITFALAVKVIVLILGAFGIEIICGKQYLLTLEYHLLQY